MIFKSAPSVPGDGHYQNFTIGDTDVIRNILESTTAPCVHVMPRKRSTCRVRHTACAMRAESGVLCTFSEPRDTTNGLCFSKQNWRISIHVVLQEQASVFIVCKQLE